MFAFSLFFLAAVAAPDPWASVSADPWTNVEPAVTVEVEAEAAIVAVPKADQFAPTPNIHRLAPQCGPTGCPVAVVAPPATDAAASVQQPYRVERPHSRRPRRLLRVLFRCR